MANVTKEVRPGFVAEVGTVEIPSFQVDSLNGVMERAAEAQSKIPYLDVPVYVLHRYIEGGLVGVLPQAGQDDLRSEAEERGEEVEGNRLDQKRCFHYCEPNIL